MPDDQDITLDQMRARLKELGIPVDGWTQTKDGPMDSPLINRQREALVQIRDVLQQQVESDKALLAELHEKKNRLQHGGGQ